MQVEIVYFQAVRRMTGRDRETLDLPDGSTVADLVGVLQTRYPELKGYRGSLLYAVNEEHAEPQTCLSNRDVVAVMPPFSGG